jgi:trigger factor
MSSNAEILVAVRETRSWSRRLSITVPPDRVLRTRGAVAGQIAKTVRLPGFRKGHVPERVLERQFGASIEQETLDRVIQEAFREALEKEGLHPITQAAVENVRYEEKAVSFEVEFEIQPEIQLARTGGFTVTRPSEEVSDEELDAVLERLRDERGVWAPVTEGTPRHGDQVQVEITPLDEDADGGGTDPRDYRFVLGEGQAIPDVEQAIFALSPGAEEEELAIRFPDDFADPAQAGKEQRLRLKLNAVQRKELPPLDDDLAREVGDFEDLAGLRARIRDDMAQHAVERAEGELRDQLITQLLEANPFEVPDSMVDRYLAHLTGESEEQPTKLTGEQKEQISQWRQTLRPQAERSLRRMMAVERIAEVEGLAATGDDVDARVSALAEASGQTASELWLQLEKNKGLRGMESEITEDKVFEHLKSRSNIL